MSPRGPEAAAWPVGSGVWTAALVLAVAAGCAPEGEPANGPSPEEDPAAYRVGEVGPDTLVGTVRQVGNVPFTRVVVEAEPPSVVVGPFERELARLAGAEVRVTGRRTEAGGPGPAFRAASYEILSVDGERPFVGVLAEGDAGHRLEAPGGHSVRLGALSLRLRRSVGARVWVTLGPDRTVRRYGILREPEEAGEEESPAGEPPDREPDGTVPVPEGGAGPA